MAGPVSGCSTRTIDRTRPHRVADQQVEDGLAVRPDGREGLAAAVAPGQTGGQYDERAQAGHALLGRHPPHWNTALAHVMPPPKPVSSTWWPAWSRSVSRASASARGMEADEVLP